MKAAVTAVVTGNILKLCINVPQQILDVALQIPGQSPIVEHHITLIRFDDLGISPNVSLIPAPPAEIEFESDVYFVNTGVKQACVINVTDAEQSMLKAYTLACLRVLALPAECLDSSRVFHATLTNAGNGDVRASIGEPWKFSNRTI